MNRRDFVRSSAAASIAYLSSYSLLGALQCGPFVPPGVQACTAGLRSDVTDITAGAVGGQHQSEWCWAACLEMVFRYYGFHVSQQQIVQETWGTIVNLPGSPQQIM